MTKSIALYTYTSVFIVFNLSCLVLLPKHALLSDLSKE